MKSLFSDRFRDPIGWLCASLPWPLRRLVLAVQLRSWPPSSARNIDLRRPPKHVFDYFRRLHGLDDSTSSLHAGAEGAFQTAPSADEWNLAYAEAMQWRDWQECDRLLVERESAPWWTKS